MTPNVCDLNDKKPMCGHCEHDWHQLTSTISPSYYRAEFCPLCYLLRVRCWRGDWQYRAPLPFGLLPDGVVPMLG